MAGAARDGFMATVGHLLNRRGSPIAHDADASAAHKSPSNQAQASLQGAGLSMGSSGEMTPAGSVDLGAILRTCAQPLSAETLAYLRSSGPPRSLCHEDGFDSSAPPSPAHNTPRAEQRSAPAPSDGFSSMASSPVRVKPPDDLSVPSVINIGLSPASGAGSTVQGSPVQLMLPDGSGWQPGRQRLAPSPSPGRGLGSTELSWDGAGLNPVDAEDDVSPFEMLLSAPEELAGAFSAPVRPWITAYMMAALDDRGEAKSRACQCPCCRAGDENGNLAFMDSIAAAAAEPKSFADTDDTWSHEARLRQVYVLFPSCDATHCSTHGLRTR